jgi:hypothetical protein
MKRSTLVFALSSLVFIGVSGCNSAKKDVPASAPQAQPAATATMAPAQAPASAQAPAGDSLSGKVVETMNSGGYTYVYLENNGKKTWVAVPQTAVTVGQMVTCQPGMEMKNFTSKTLNRTFASVYFSGGLR